MPEEIFPPQVLADMRRVYGGFLGPKERKQVADLLRLYKKDFKGFLAMMVPLERDFLRVQERARETTGAFTPAPDAKLEPDEAQRLVERELDQCLVESRLHLAQEAARQSRVAGGDWQAGGGI